LPYDLVVRSYGKVPFDRVLEYARAAPWIEVDGDADGVLITNTNTGVYASIAPEGAQVLFAVHYQRPQFFAREAFMMAQTFIALFGWRLFDPQREIELQGGGDEIEAALSEWRVRNAVHDRRPDAVAIDARAAADAWNWNYARPQTQRSFAQDDPEREVPRLVYVRAPGVRRARTAAFWTHGVRHILLPASDYLVYRDERSAEWIIDRAALAANAAYYSRANQADGALVVEATRFSLLISALDQSKRGEFRAAVLPADTLIET